MEEELHQLIVGLGASLKAPSAPKNKSSKLAFLKRSKEANPLLFSLVPGKRGGVEIFGV